ncbi:uncharacterized protein V1518DRAFT_73864 [Limtongia smithiae]|uniref:uncharacterized protein n=1 Tax=Limtongia smithiae TaxID=1125753 RepID=UPI0034CD3E46
MAPNKSKRKRKSRDYDFSNAEVVKISVGNHTPPDGERGPDYESVSDIEDPVYDYNHRPKKKPVRPQPLAKPTRGSDYEDSDDEDEMQQAMTKKGPSERLDQSDDDIPDHEKLPLWQQTQTLEQAEKPYRWGTPQSNYRPARESSFSPAPAPTASIAPSFSSAPPPRIGGKYAYLEKEAQSVSRSYDRGRFTSSLYRLFSYDEQPSFPQTYSQRLRPRSPSPYDKDDNFRERYRLPGRRDGLSNQFPDRQPPARLPDFAPTKSYRRIQAPVIVPPLPRADREEHRPTPQTAPTTSNAIPSTIHRQDSLPSQARSPVKPASTPCTTARNSFHNPIVVDRDIPDAEPAPTVAAPPATTVAAPPATRFQVSLPYAPMIIDLTEPTPAELRARKEAAQAAQLTPAVPALASPARTAVPTPSLFRRLQAASTDAKLASRELDRNPRSCKQTPAPRLTASETLPEVSKPIESFTTKTQGSAQTEGGQLLANAKVGAPELLANSSIRPSAAPPTPVAINLFSLSRTKKSTPAVLAPTSSKYVVQAEPASLRHNISFKPESPDYLAPPVETTASSASQLERQPPAVDSFESDEEDYSDDFEIFDPMDEYEEAERTSKRYANEMTPLQPYVRPRSLPKPTMAVPRATIMASLLQYVDTSRTPYLSTGARDSLRRFGQWEALPALVGKRIHADFSAWELEQIIKAYRQHGFVDVESIAAILIRRSPEDVVRFIEDGCAIPERPTSIILRELGVRQSIELMPLLTKREIYADKRARSSANARSLTRFHGVRTTTRGSGDAMNIDFSPDSKYAAVGCVASFDSYSQSGNLMLVNLMTSGINLLDSHRYVSPNNESIYYTVSGVRFSQFSNMLFTASYDRTVRAWDAGTRRELAKIPLHGEPSLMRGGLFNRSELLAVGCAMATGVTQIIPVNVENENVFGTPHDIKIRDNDSRGLVTALDFLSSRGGAAKIIAGYEMKVSDSVKPLASGVMISIDVKSMAMTKFSLRRPYTDIYVHPEEPFIISSCTLPYTSYQRGSTVNVFDFHNMSSKAPSPVCEIKSMQTDVNRVTLSRDMKYATSSGTDGSTYVYDMRSYGVPLHRLAHGTPRVAEHHDMQPEDYDTGVQVCLWPEQSLQHVITGSSDGCVKLWDIRTGNLVKDMLEVSSPIMGGEFSRDGETLLFGDSAGHLYELIQSGSVNDPMMNFTVHENMI